MVLRNPSSPRLPSPPGTDAVETFFLCIVLGFRGTHRDNPQKIKEYVEGMRPQVTRTIAWSSPRDIGVKTNVEPLLGRETLHRVVAIYGGLSLLVILVLLILYRIIL